MTSAKLLPPDYFARQLCLITISARLLDSISAISGKTIVSALVSDYLYSPGARLLVHDQLFGLLYQEAVLNHCK